MQNHKNVTVIPATINPLTRMPKAAVQLRRVAGYARVSTDSEEQQTSYEAQVDYYTRYIRSRADWQFVDVYTDEGISATNTKRREGFNRMVADSLRQPLEDGAVTITRAAGRTRYPCNFMLVCAMNPCKCGWHGYEGEAHECTCSEQSINNYMGKISGPLLDRIDIHISVPAVTYDDMSGNKQSEGSADIRKRVNAARKRAHTRGVSCNAQLSGSRLREIIQLDDAASSLLKAAFDSLGLTGRSYDKILRLALTISDLAGSDVVLASHIAEAIQYRSLDRETD